jgi:hypothetical protein
MEHKLYAAGCRVDPLVAAQLAFENLDIVLEIGQISAASGGEVIQDAHAVSTLEERSYEIRANESGASRD